MKRKLAIVLSGGGMTCSYTAGFLSALVNEYKLTEPDILIAGSGSSGTATVYVTKQYDSMTNIWANRLCNKDFINIFRANRILDIDYLIDTVLKKVEPLVVRNIYSSKTLLLIPATNTKTGQVRYFSNKDGDIDWFEVMRASKAMPVFYNKKIQIDGQKYFDSPLSSRVDLDIIKAIDLGATHILAVTTESDEAGFGYRAYLRSRSNAFQKNYAYLEKKAKSFTCPENVTLLKIRPQGSLPVRTLNNSNQELCKTIEIGYSECKNNFELRKFILEATA